MGKKNLKGDEGPEEKTSLAVDGPHQAKQCRSHEQLQHNTPITGQRSQEVQQPQKQKKNGKDGGRDDDRRLQQVQSSKRKAPLHEGDRSKCSSESL